jgi:hypothetical protein
MIAVGILGGLILVSVACLGVVYLFSSNSNNTAQQAQAAAATQTAIAAKNFINQALTATFQASILPTATLSPTPTATPPVSVPSATSTLVQALVPTTPAAGPGTQSAATATVAAALTQAAAAQKTIMVTTTALPGTGIADEYGLPGLVVMALAFVIVILFARRLRAAPVR